MFFFCRAAFVCNTKPLNIEVIYKQNPLKTNKSNKIKETNKQTTNRTDVPM